MDRWEDSDGLDGGPKAPMTGVSKMGMSAFIKSSEGKSATPGQEAARIEVVASKREQKRALMPPPPPVQPSRPIGQPAHPGSFRAPEWAGAPPGPAHLHVLKDGQVIQSIPLQQPATLFGRSPAADVVLDHPSLSRQHAAVCYKRSTERWVVLDLNSAHGTTADGKPVTRGSPVALGEGSVLRFAASSREYVLRQSLDAAAEAHPSAAADSTAAQPPAKKRKGVKWPDKGDAERPLESIIGYSDGGDFALRVGPQPADDSSSGRFADLVQSRVVATKDKEGQQQEQSQETNVAGGEQQRQQHAQQQKAAAARKKDAEEAARRHIAQPFLKQSLYDFLPPPTQSSAQPS